MTTISVEARNRLLQRRAAIERLTSDLNEEEAQLGRESHADVVDAAAAAEPRPVLETLRRAQLEELREIEAALHRIASGAYGTCESCGKPIAQKRLRAIPTARACFACTASVREVASAA
jgi:RNA polymerase-binding transcription factor DksA